MAIARLAKDYPNKRRAETNHLPILCKINAILIPQIPASTALCLLNQLHNQPRQIRNMDITPTTQSVPNLHPLPALNRGLGQIRKLDTPLIHKATTKSINQGPVNDSRPDIGLFGRQAQEQVVNDALRR